MFLLYFMVFFTLLQHELVEDLKNKSNKEISKMVYQVDKQTHKVALVTGGGGNRGIGRETSRQLALRGYHVLI